MKHFNDWLGFWRPTPHRASGDGGGLLNQQGQPHNPTEQLTHHHENEARRASVTTTDISNSHHNQPIQPINRHHMITTHSTGHGLLPRSHHRSHHHTALNISPYRFPPPPQPVYNYAGSSSMSKLITSSDTTTTSTTTSNNNAEKEVEQQQHKQEEEEEVVITAQPAIPHAFSTKKDEVAHFIDRPCSRLSDKPSLFSPRTVQFGTNTESKSNPNNLPPKPTPEELYYANPSAISASSRKSASRVPPKKEEVPRVGSYRCQSMDNLLTSSAVQKRGIRTWSRTREYVATSSGEEQYSQSARRPKRKCKTPSARRIRKTDDSTLTPRSPYNRGLKLAQSKSRDSLVSPIGTPMLSISSGQPSPFLSDDEHNVIMSSDNIELGQYKDTTNPSEISHTTGRSRSSTPSVINSGRSRNSAKTSNDPSVSVPSDIGMSDTTIDNQEGKEDETELLSNAVGMTSNTGNDRTIKNHHTQQPTHHTSDDTDAELNHVNQHPNMPKSDLSSVFPDPSHTSPDDSSIHSHRSKNHKSKILSNPWEITLVSLASVAIILIVAFAIYCVLRRQKKRNNRRDRNHFNHGALRRGGSVNNAGDTHLPSGKKSPLVEKYLQRLRKNSEHPRNLFDEVQMANLAGGQLPSPPTTASSSSGANSQPKRSPTIRDVESGNLDELRKEQELSIQRRFDDEESWDNITFVDVSFCQRNQSWSFSLPKLNEGTEDRHEWVDEQIFALLTQNSESLLPVIQRAQSEHFGPVIRDQSNNRQSLFSRRNPFDKRLECLRIATDNGISALSAASSTSALSSTVSLKRCATPMPGINAGKIKSIELTTLSSNDQTSNDDKNNHNIDDEEKVESPRVNTPSPLIERVIRRRASI